MKSWHQLSGNTNRLDREDHCYTETRLTLLIWRCEQPLAHQTDKTTVADIDVLIRRSARVCMAGRRRPVAWCGCSSAGAFVVQDLGEDAEDFGQVGLVGHDLPDVRP